MPHGNDRLFWCNQTPRPASPRMDASVDDVGCDQQRLPATKNCKGSAVTNPAHSRAEARRPGATSGTPVAKNCKGSAFAIPTRSRAAGCDQRRPCYEELSGISLRNPDSLPGSRVRPAAPVLRRTLGDQPSQSRLAAGQKPGSRREGLSPHEARTYYLGKASRMILTFCSTVRLAVSMTRCSRSHG